MSKRKATSLADKYKYIQRIENNECTHLELANETGIGRSTITKWRIIKTSKILEANENRSREYFF